MKFEFFPNFFVFQCLFQSHFVWVQFQLKCSPPHKNNIFHLAWKNSQNSCETTPFPSIKSATIHFKESSTSLLEIIILSKRVFCIAIAIALTGPTWILPLLLKPVLSQDLLYEPCLETDFSTKHSSESILPENNKSDPCILDPITLDLGSPNCALHSLETLIATRPSHSMQRLDYL